MKQEIVSIHSIKYLTPEILELSFISDYVSSVAQPAQFVNIRVGNNYPLLRRPFSIYDIKNNRVSITFNVIGTGTKILARKKVGETIDIIGPCGNSFLDFTEGDYETAVFVAGGIGVAPFLFLTKRFPPQRKIITYLGARHKELIADQGLVNVHIATDNGSLGFKGTVLDLIKDDFSKNDYGKTRFFICGPNRMMKSVAEFAKERKSECYASLESEMACGIGLCQGCNVEMTRGEKKYKLICSEGTIFETQTVKFQ